LDAGSGRHVGEAFSAKDAMGARRTQGISRGDAEPRRIRATHIRLCARKLSLAREARRTCSNGLAITNLAKPTQYAAAPRLRVKSLASFAKPCGLCVKKMARCRRDRGDLKRRDNSAPRASPPRHGHGSRANRSR
jgi:hypothetical protein